MTKRLDRASAALGAALAVAMLGGCASAPFGSESADSAQGAVAPAAAPRSKATKPAARPQPASREYRAVAVAGDFAGKPVVERFIGRMSDRHGFSREYLAGVLSQAERKQWTLDYLSRESAPGPVRPGGWSRYREKFLTDGHISGGVEFWRDNAKALDRASRQYGVPPEYIVGIIGVETIYGRNVGSHRVIDALATLSFDYPRRADYFSGELENFLIMARDQRFDPLSPKGSYAGAMGLGQFMPTSYLKWAVDLDGDGRKDLWDPEDAIGSVGNYFAAHGWRSGQPVVTTAAATGARASTLDAGLDTRYSLAALASNDIRPALQSAPQDDLRLLRLSAHSGDEYWLGYHNFSVITRYNKSTYYAMAVHQLAQAVKQRYQSTMVAQR